MKIHENSFHVTSTLFKSRNTTVSSCNIQYRAYCLNTSPRAFLRKDNPRPRTRSMDSLNAERRSMVSRVLQKVPPTSARRMALATTWLDARGVSRERGVWGKPVATENILKCSRAALPNSKKGCWGKTAVKATLKSRLFVHNPRGAVYAWKQRLRHMLLDMRKKRKEKKETI